MFSVPGRYAGGAGAGYTWEQSLNEIELKAPVPKGPPERSVSCTFGPKRLQLEFKSGSDEAMEQVAVGELSAVLAAGDCLWSVERDDAGNAIAVVSMRKAKPEVWTKLFAADPEPAEKPELLDGVKRTEPQSRQELLKQAKERLKDELDGPSRAKPHAFEKLVDVTRVIEASELPELPVVIVRGCTGCTITLPASLTLIKLQIEQCTNCTIEVGARLLTETVEVWACDDCAVRLGSMSRTVQLDKCARLALTFGSVAFFDRIMHTGPRGVALKFDDAAFLDTTLDLDALRKAQNDETIDEETDQFITRRVGSEAQSLQTELIIRLCNDFPTTDREVADFERRTRMHEGKLDEVVDGMLGSSLGRSLTDAEKEQMKEMMRQQSAAASAAQVQTEQTAEGRKEARVTFKKNEGNAAFKAGNYQQAAVFYTEALALDASQHALYSNRAACFLKLGRYAQAREDATECTKLAPSFAKGHFRLALALQAEEKPAEACNAFGKALEIEPGNKEAIAGLNMSRMQAERLRRQQAGAVDLN